MPKFSHRLPHFISKAEFADNVGVSERTVSRWIASGDLRAHRFGNSVRIAEEDAVSFIAISRR
jgi:excisionase family DNA binding protein